MSNAISNTVQEINTLKCTLKNLTLSNNKKDRESKAKEFIVTKQRKVRYNEIFGTNFFYLVI